MKRMYVHPTILKLLEVLKEVESLEISSKKDYARHHRRLVDVQHEIELSDDYDEELKCHVFDHLKDISAERRQAKDTMFLLDCLKRRLQSGTDLDSLSKLISEVEQEWVRNYFPRSEKSLDFSSTSTLKDSRVKLLTRENTNENE